MQLWSIFERVFIAVTPVFLVSGIGFFYIWYKNKSFKNNNNNNINNKPLNIDGLNTIMIEIASPLLLFTALSDKNFDVYQQRWIIIGGLGVVLGSGLLAWAVALWRGYNLKGFILPAMFNNCGNMGLPLALFAFGEEGLKAAVALFMACNLLQMTLGIKILSPDSSLYTVLKTPLTMGMFLGLLANLLQIYHPQWHIPMPIFEGLKLLGQSAIPMMLLMLGIRMAQSTLTISKAGIVCAILNPLAGILMAYIMQYLLPLTPKEFGYLLLFASLPPAIMNTLMAVRYNADAPQTMSAVVWGHVISLVAVPLAIAIGFIN